MTVVSVSKQVCLRCRLSPLWCGSFYQDDRSFSRPVLSPKGALNPFVVRTIGPDKNWTDCLSLWTWLRICCVLLELVRVFSTGRGLIDCDFQIIPTNFHNFHSIRSEQLFLTEVLTAVWTASSCFSYSSIKFFWWLVTLPRFWQFLELRVAFNCSILSSISTHDMTPLKNSKGIFYSSLTHYSGNFDWSSTS